LTNMLEGVHGNGILLEEDTATTASNRNTPEDLPGVCEQVSLPYKINIQGGHAILDGVLYKFAGGPGSSQEVEFTTTSQHARASYASGYLSAGEEALIVVYVSSDNASNHCITWEIGTPVTTASNTYPTTPSAFLSDPKSGLAVKQSVVLAVIRVVYSASGGDMNLSIAESNDKRVFVRPNPMYLTPVTTGTVGNKTAVDSHTALDALHTDNGDFATSRLGALWQSYNSDGDAILYYSANDSNDDRHTHVLGPVGYVSASPSATTTFTFNEGQVFVLNPSTAIQFNPSGTFPPGHKVFVTNEAAHGANSITFDNAGIGIVLQGKESGLFVYTGSAWKNVMLASGAISPNGHGASGLIQISDGAGGFTSDADLSWDAVAGELTIDGKLTVTGLIDPTGLVLDPQATNPEPGSPPNDNTLWIKTTDSRIQQGSVAVMRAGDDISELTNDAGFIDAAAASAAAPVQSVNTATGAVVLDADDIDDTSTTNKFTTATDISKLAGIETNATADQTDGEIKTAYENNANTNAFTDAEQTKLGTIDTNADVTDTASVRAAGALMDDELTSIDDVKAFDSNNYATAAQGALADTALQSESVSSVFGRTGAVVATSGDYDDGEITAAASATNYTPTASTVEGHLAGIDTALASAGSITGQYQKFVLDASLTGLSDGATTQLSFGPFGGSGSGLLYEQYDPAAITDFSFDPITPDHLIINADGLYQFTFAGFLAAISGGTTIDYRLTISSTVSLTGDILSFRNRTVYIDRYSGSGVSTVYLTTGTQVFFSVFVSGRTYEVGGLLAGPETRTFVDVRRLE